ncbi:MAG: serine protease [Deltaproteobacteria bacterium]|nr:MAG: serine protease [Deltaproteobacteria bacterium]
MTTRATRPDPLRRVALALAVVAALALPLTGGADERARRILQQVMPSVVYIISVEVRGDQLVPVQTGSGTIITEDGSIITNYHVLNNAKEGRLFDAFVVGRFRAPDREPELVCGGVPAEGVLDPELDLALIKCRVDMSGRPLSPAGWPAIRIGDSRQLVPGEQLTILGYPGVGGGTIHVTSGELSGWQGPRGGAGRAFIKTDAQVAHGNSGGTAINEDGEYIGVPTAFHLETQDFGGVVATAGNVGLIRPIEHAEPLIAIARRGWTPRRQRVADGPGPSRPEEAAPAAPANEAQEEPNPAPAQEAPSPAGPADGGRPEPSPPPAPRRSGFQPGRSEGVVVVGRVVDAANGRPIAGAFMIVFKPGIRTGDLDPKRLEQQALTFGQADERGQFSTMHRVPRGASYTVLVAADGYVPLIRDDVLVVGPDAPDRFDPWEAIALDRR